jgi:hypothetical protein
VVIKQRGGRLLRGTPRLLWYCWSGVRPEHLPSSLCPAIRQEANRNHLKVGFDAGV